MRNEMFHYTEAQVRDHLALALTIVEELDPSADLRTAVFEKAATMLAAKNITVEQVRPGVLGMAIPRG